MSTELEKMTKLREEMLKDYEEMQEMKQAIDEGLEELQTRSVRNLLSLATGAVVSGCAYTIMDKVATLFIPKNLRPIAKIGVAAGSFFIPELLGEVTAKQVDGILEEDN